MISSRFCQRERFSSVESLRVISFEPATSTSISPHVNTIVPLSLKYPCCQKIIWSGLRRMGSLLFRAAWVFRPQPGQPCDGETRNDKPQKAREQPLPLAAGNKVKSRQDNAHAQQPAAEKPERRPGGRDPLANRPPQSAEKKRSETSASQPRQRQCQRFIHRHPPVRPASPCPAGQPSTTHSNSRR